MTKAAHSPECIERYRQRYAENEEGQRRIAEADLRQLRYAERLSRGAASNARREADRGTRFEELPGDSGPPAEVRLSKGIEETQAPASIQSEAADDIMVPTDAEDEPEQDDPMEEARTADEVMHQGDVGELDVDIMELMGEELHQDDIAEVRKLDQEVMQTIRDVGGSSKGLQEAAEAIMASRAHGGIQPPESHSVRQTPARIWSCPGHGL